MNLQPDTAHFVELLQEQFDLLRSLIERGHEQMVAIEAGRMNELIAILARKQPELERLEAVRQSLQDMRPAVENDAFWPTEELRRQCQGLRDDAAQGFETLIEIERSCEVAITETRDHLDQRLRQMDSGRIASSAYQSQSAVTSTPRIDFSSLG